jgi:hypothetical protein
MLTDIQIEDLAKRMTIPLERVCFKDDLIDRHLVYNAGYIINLEDSQTNGHENEGTHWTALYVKKDLKTGVVEPIYFDSFGAPPSESVKEFVMKGCGKKLPYTTKDIQSLINNACGWFCLSLLHFITTKHINGLPDDLYSRVSQYQELFLDLNIYTDYKQNEWVLSNFFRSADPKLRREINVIAPVESIMAQDHK